MQTLQLSPDECVKNKAPFLINIPSNNQHNAYIYVFSLNI